MRDAEFLTVADAARTLGVSTRHARRLADAGSIDGIARGLIDRESVERYVRSQRRGRTRAWAEHTAWGAVALLAGSSPDWLGAAQQSRLRHTLRDLEDVSDLLTRMRDRATVHRFHVHRAALPWLRERVTAGDWAQLRLSVAGDDTIDGYLPASDLTDVVQSLHLRADHHGPVTLRVTGFDFDRIRGLVGSRVVAALDAAIETDPRVRGVGQRALGALLRGYR